MKALRDLLTPLLPLSLLVTSGREPISPADWAITALFIVAVVFLWLTLRD